MGKAGEGRRKAPPSSKTEPLSTATGRDALVCLPEPRQGFTVRAFAELLEGPIPDLPDSLTRYAQEGPDLLEGPLLSVIQPVVEVEDLSLFICA